MTDMNVTAFDLYTSIDTPTLTRMKISMEGNVEMMDEILAERDARGRLISTDHPDIFKVDGKFWVYGEDCIGNHDVIAVEDDYDDALEIAEAFSV